VEIGEPRYRRGGSGMRVSSLRVAEYDKPKNDEKQEKGDGSVIRIFLPN
jgi:hypothetical protein